MDRFDFGAHSSSHYNEELTTIHRYLMEMGGLVQQQVSDATQALLKGDALLANAVMDSEDRVDTLEKLIDENCAHVLALRQPAATDLRLLLAVSKCVSDFERIGDESVKVAVIANELIESDVSGDHASVREIGAHVSRMLAAALQAFARLDAKKAVEVAVDMEYRQALRTLVTRKVQDAEAIPNQLSITWALRSLERVGDHAHNIAEQVIYLVTGKDVRHLSIEQITQEVGVR